jgi:capsular polysaccharide biosynthesis protein
MEFRDFLSLMWRRKKTLFFVPLLAAVLFLLATQVSPPRYEAGATLMLKSELRDPWQKTFIQPQADEELLKTCIRLLDGNAFLLEVIKTLPFEMNLKTLRESLRYDNPEGSKLIRLSVLAEDPQRAARIVNSAAELAPKRLGAVLNESEILIVEKASITEDRRRAAVPLGLGLTVFLSFLWTLTIVMFMDNIWRLRHTARHCEDI